MRFSIAHPSSFKRKMRDARNLKFSCQFVKWSLISFCQWRHVYVLMSELSTICLKLLNCKSSCDVRLQVWFIFHSHWCLMSVSSQGYGSNTQLLPPNITAYSQFLESTESMDAFNVPVTFLIQIHVPVAFVVQCLVSLSLITGLRPQH